MNKMLRTFTMVVATVTVESVKITGSLDIPMELQDPTQCRSSDGELYDFGDGAHYEGQLTPARDACGVGQVTDPTYSELGNDTWNGGFKDGMKHGEGVRWRPQRE